MIGGVFFAWWYVIFPLTLLSWILYAIEARKERRDDRD